MPQYLTSPVAQLVILLAVMATLVAVGVYLVRRFRGGAEEGEPSASELMSNFRELHARGQLSDQEYRRIKTQLAARLQQELNDTGDKA